MQTFPARYTLRALLEDYAAHRRPVVVALVVVTRGSSYRKAGALALIDKDGLVCGCISGGCLEAELVDAALRVLASGVDARLRLDTRTDEDRWFGSQSGCRGEVDLLLMAGAAGGRHRLLEALLKAAVARHSLRVLVDLEAAVPTSRIGDNPAASNEIAVRIDPVPRVLLLGGGPEAPPLIELARTLGWWLEVVEHRGRYLAQARLAAADRVHCARSCEALEALLTEGFDAVICATHLFEEDRHCLELLATSTVPLIGVLGPVVRGQELLGELSREQRSALDGRVHAPFGIALGAYGPESVALSIAARLTEAFARG